MKILITGGAGFIGSHVQDVYLDAGHEVLVVDDLSHGNRENLRPETRFFQMDVRSPAVAELIAREKPDAVGHFAAQMEVRRSVEDPFFDAEVNILGGLRVLKAAAECGTPKFIFASTGGAIYGEQTEFPASESHVCAPLSPYGITKLAFEKYLHYFHVLTGIRTVCLRYANVYGPRQDPQGEAGVVAIFAQKFLAGQSPTIFGDGSQTRDYVFVGDVARANLLALGDVPPGCYNIGTGVETDVNRLCGLLAGLLGSKLPAIHAAAKAGDLARSCLSAKRAQEVLGWRPQVGLEEGLSRTSEFFRQRSRAAH
ncbi:MAG: NAD-dependent epimerase/dehydratase family protein [Candidatus Riflebacteria bacterium]|nr:NAD-dependent epimerase/dehydratase family protein [Candidatus Riflebacteria bacterium]